MWWPFKRAPEGDLSAARYHRKLGHLERAEARLKSVCEEQKALLQKMESELEKVQDALQFEIEQSQAMLRQYKKECDRLKDENEVQGSTIDAMTANHNRIVQSLRADAALHSIRRQVAQNPGDE